MHPSGDDKTYLTVKSVRRGWGSEDSRILNELAVLIGVSICRARGDVRAEHFPVLVEFMVVGGVGRGGCAQLFGSLSYLLRIAGRRFRLLRHRERPRGPTDRGQGRIPERERVEPAGRRQVASL